MKRKPKVSVIIPVYGRTDYLSEAIDSVFEQTYRSFELILVDDNNPNSKFRNTTQVIVSHHQSMGRDIKYIKHDQNRNGSAARNTGVRNSSGEFISFLDSDDRYWPRRLEVAVKVMEGEDERIGGFYSGVDFWRNGRQRNAYRTAPSGRFLLDTLACRFKFGSGSNLFIRRSVFDLLGGFDEAFWRHQDYEFLARFFKDFELAGVNEILVRKNDEKYNLPNFARSLEIKEQYLEKFRNIIESMTDLDRDYIIRCNYIWLGEIALREGLRRMSAEMYMVAKHHGKIDFRDNLRRGIFWLLSWKK